MSLKEKLLNIQQELKAPKDQFNSFGNYSYRNQEDILEAIKPLLAKHRVSLRLTDEVVNIGVHNYVKAKAIIVDLDEDVFIEVFAHAREAETRKGMDDSQLTGSCSSYARKYALNGLFLIDDTQDADTKDNRASNPNEGKKPSGAIGKIDKDKTGWLPKVVTYIESGGFGKALNFATSLIDKDILAKTKKLVDLQKEFDRTGMTPVQAFEYASLGDIAKLKTDQIQSFIDQLKTME